MSRPSLEAVPYDGPSPEHVQPTSEIFETAWFRRSPIPVYPARKKARSTGVIRDRISGPHEPTDLALTMPAQRSLALS